MSDLGDRAATLSLGVTSNQALEELTRLGQGLKDFKTALTEFSRTQIPDPFAGLSQAAKTSVIDIIETLKKGGDVAQVEAAAVGSKASVSFSQAFSNGIRGNVKLTGDAAKEYLQVIESSLKEAQSKGIQLKADELAAAKAAAEEQKRIVAGQVQDVYIYRQKGEDQWRKLKADEVAAAKAASDAERQTVAEQMQETYIYQQRGTERWKQLKADELAAAKAAAEAERQLILNNNFNTASPQSQLNTAKKAAGLVGADEEALALQKYGAAAVAASKDLDKLKQAAAEAGKSVNDHRIPYQLFGQDLRLTSTASRELLAVLHELSTGRFTMAPGSFMSFLLYSGVEGTTILGVVGALLALASTVGVLAVAFAKGKVEMDEMNRAISSTNDYAGVTRGSMDELAVSVSNSSRITVGAAKESVTALVASGKIGASAISAVANSIGNYAAISGKTAEQATGDLVKIFSDPTKGANELNASMHFLSAAELIHIQNLQEQGNLTEAQAELAGKLQAQLAKTEVNLGTLQKAWDGVKHAASDAWDAMLSIGKEDTLNEKLDAASIRLLQAKSAAQFTTTHGYFDADQFKAEYTKALENYKKLLADKKKEDADAAKAAADAEKNQQDSFALSAAQAKSYAQQLTALTNAKAAASKLKTDTPELKAIHDSSLAEINKEIFALQGGNAIIDARLKLRKGELDQQIQQIEADGKIGKLGEAQVLQEKLKLELMKNQAEVNAERAKPTATPTESITKQGNIAELMQQRYALVQAEVNAEDQLHENQLHNEWKAEGEALTKQGDLVGGFWKKWHAENDATLAKLASDNAMTAYNALVAAGNAAAQTTLFDDEKNKAEALFNELKDKLAQINGEAATNGGLVGMLNAGLAAQQIKAELIPQIQILLDKMKETGGENAGLQKLVSKLESQVTKVALELPPTWKKIADSIETSLTDALDRSLRQKGKSFAQDLADAIKKTLENLSINLVVHALVDPVMGGIRGAMGAVASGGSAIQGFTNGFSGISSPFGSSFGSTGSMYSSFANSSFGQSLGLSTAASAGYTSALSTAVPGLVGDSVLTSTPGFLIADGAATGTAGGLTAAGSTLGSAFGAIGTAMPYIGAALALYSLFSSGGGDDPHNNASYNGLSLSLSQAGVGDSIGKSPYGFTAGATSGKGWWAENTNLTSTQTDAINKQVASIFSSGTSLAKLLGVDPSVLNSVKVDSATDGTAHAGLINSFTSVDAAMAALADKIATALIPNIGAFQQSGETLSQTIQRVVGDIQGFDAITKHLGMTVNLAGDAQTRAQTVENIIAAGGGSQAFSSNLQAFYQGFYSDTERLVAAQKDLDAQFKALGVATPQSKDAFRALVTGIDLTTAQGQTLFGQLIALAPAFAQVADAASSAGTAIGGLTSQVSDAQKAAVSAISAQISLSQTAATTAHQAADAYRALTQTLSDAVTQLKLGDLSPYKSGQKLSTASDSLDQVFAKAMGGDQTALGDLPKVAQDFLTASRAFNSSSDAYTADFNRVMQMLAQAQGASTGAAAAKDYQATLLDTQTALLGQIKDQLALATPNTAILAQQATLLQTIGGLLSGQYASVLTGNAISDAIRNITANDAQVTASQLQDLVQGTTVQTDQFTAMVQGTNTTVGLLQQLVNLTTQMLQFQITNMYQALLGRAPDAAGLQYWTNQAASGLSTATISASIAATPEAQDRAAITKVYETLLAREPDAGGLNYWVGSMLAGRSLSDVTNDIIVAAQAQGVVIPGHANGLDRVPYDNYLMYAHQNEAVLTSQEADKWRRGEVGITSADIAALSDRIERLIAVVQAGDQANVNATNKVATAHQDVAHRAEVQTVTLR